MPYKHSGTIEDRTYRLRYRPALSVISSILEDPELRGELVWYPERRYVRKPGTNENMRVWCEVESGDDWWALHVGK